MDISGRYREADKGYVRSREQSQGPLHCFRSGSVLRLNDVQTPVKSRERMARLASYGSEEIGQEGINPRRRRRATSEKTVLFLE